MRRALGPLVLWVAALLADAAFTRIAGHEGLLAPFGPVHVSTLLAGALALSTRLLATALLLPWLAWRLTARPRARAGSEVGL